MSLFKPPTPPAGCETLEQHERSTTELANKLEAQIAELLAGNDLAPMVVSRAKELALAVVRLRKLASELATAREDREHDRWLVREHQRMSNHEIPPRPRLQRRKPTQ